MLINSGEYIETIEQIKQEIRAAQYKAALQVNQELILLYHSIGTVINEHKTWGNKFVDSLAKDIKLSFPNATGFSARNLKYMAKFSQAYPDREFVQTVSAQIPWSHNIAILEKVPADGFAWARLQRYRPRIRPGLVNMVNACRRAAGDGCPYERDAANANVQTLRLFGLLFRFFLLYCMYIDSTQEVPV